MIFLIMMIASVPQLPAMEALSDCAIREELRLTEKDRAEHRPIPAETVAHAAVIACDRFFEPVRIEQETIAKRDYPDLVRALEAEERPLRTPEQSRVLRAKMARAAVEAAETEFLRDPSFEARAKELLQRNRQNAQN